MNKIWPAPAKLNRFLHITGRRADGFHELQTLFHLLDWGDQLQFAVTDDGRICRQREVPGIPDSQDLCIRAAQLLQAESGCRRGVVIDLVKQIPLGSGLGGGSSDAATVLHALNRLWGCGLDVQELAGIGLRLGADVPVFVHGHTAWAEGVGERLKPVRLGEVWYLLVFPGFAISTADIFSDPELKRDSPPGNFAELDSDRSRNDCEPVVLKRFPQLLPVFRELSEWGAPRITGTGSSIFIEMNGKNAALEATRKLKSRYNVRAVRGVDRSPLLKMLSGTG